MTARGEMTMEQPSGDTLKVILSGYWKLGGELPDAENGYTALMFASKGGHQEIQEMLIKAGVKGLAAKI